MTPLCRYCGRELLDHVGVRETCPDLPAQRYVALPARPTRSWWCGCTFDFLTQRTVARCAVHAAGGGSVVSAADGILYVQASGGHLWHVLAGRASAASLPGSENPLCGFRPRKQSLQQGSRGRWTRSRTETPVWASICPRCLARLRDPGRSA